MADGRSDENDAASDAMADEGEILDIQDADYDPDAVEDTDDGGAIITMDGEDDAVDTAPDTSFYANIADDVDQSVLDTLCRELVESIEDDKKDREERDKQYAEGIKRTGLGNEAPGGASFQGASKTVHPMLSKACIDFEARVIAELMPSAGPVKDFIPGDATQQRVSKAQRKTKLMNWQFRAQMPEFYNELEQLLMQLPLGGSQYMYLRWDEKRKKPVPAFWPVDEVILPFAASNFYTSPRVTMLEKITEDEFERRVDDGIYRMPKSGNTKSPTQMPERTKSSEATDKVEGKKDSAMNKDGIRLIYKVYVRSFDIEDENPDAPYCIDIDSDNNECLSLVRNWEEDDKKMEPMIWLVDWSFLPWRGALGVGLAQVLGSLAGGTTGAIRALLDSAHINNLPTLLKLKGANMSGQSISLEATGVTEIEGGIAGDPDIRKLIMAVPFNEPSAVLLQLLGIMTEYGESVVRTTMDNISEQPSNLPVGTTLALIEQGMKVLGAIHLRLFKSMDKVILVLHRLNRMYLDDGDILDEAGEFLAKRSDFDGPMDVIPVADPQVFSDVQRFAQMQMIAQRAQLLPQLYDLRKVEEMILERSKVPDAADLLLPSQTPKEMNAVNENAAMALGRPVAAFPEQDHLAHLQVHLDFMTNPFLGQSQLIAKRFLGPCLQHIAEHVTLWYVNAFYHAVSNEMGSDLGEIMKYRDPKTRAELDKTLAMASPLVSQEASKIFNKLPPIIQQAQTLLQQVSPPQAPPGDPNVAVAQIRSSDAARKAQADQAKEAQIQQAETQRTQLAQDQENQRKAAELASKERINTQDNATAMTIAHAELSSGERVGLKDGHGINPE